MAGSPNLVVIRHARQAPPQRSPHRRGRLTPDHLLAADPRGRTVCGAEPGAHDLTNREARTKAGRLWLTCSSCLAATDPTNPPSQEDHHHG